MTELTERAYSLAPRVGVGAVVWRGRGLLLVKRLHPPHAGLWALPGGLVELGESLQQAVQREVAEETGISIEIRRLIEVMDYIERDEDDRVKYHYVLVDYEADYRGGEIESGVDVADAAWYDFGKLSEVSLSPFTQTFLMKHFSMLNCKSSS